MGEFLEPIRPEDHLPIREKVYETLRTAILRGVLQPGERVVERDIALRMAVSRTPVREAIRQLVSEGLVTHVGRKGVAVAGIQEKDVVEIYMMRGVLEGLAARLAAERIADRELDRLRSRMQEMEKLVRANRTASLNTVHLEFNDIIFRAAESPRLYHVINTLKDYVSNFTGIGYAVPGRTAQATEEHRRIVEAISARDGEAAETAVRQHMHNSLLAYRQSRRAGKDTRDEELS